MKICYISTLKCVALQTSTSDLSGHRIILYFLLNISSQKYNAITLSELDFIDRWKRTMFYVIMNLWPEGTAQ